MNVCAGKLPRRAMAGVSEEYNAAEILYLDLHYMTREVYGRGHKLAFRLKERFAIIRETLVGPEKAAELRSGEESDQEIGGVASVWEILSWDPPIGRKVVPMFTLFSSAGKMKEAHGESGDIEFGEMDAFCLPSSSRTTMPADK